MAHVSGVRAQCMDYWTAAYKCAQGCGSCGSRPAPAPPPVDPDVLRLNQLTPRFNTALSELQSYAIPNIGDLYSAPDPTSLAELGARLDRVYVEAGFYQQQKEWEFDQNRKHLTDWSAAIPELRAKISALQESLATAPQRLAEAESSRDTENAKAEQAAHDANVLRDNANALQAELAATRTSALSAMLELLPADQKSGFNDAISRGAAFEPYAIQPVSGHPVAATPIVPMTGARGVSESVVGPMQKPRPIDGPIEDRLLAVERVTASLADLIPTISAQKQRLPALEDEVGGLTRQRNSLQDEEWTFQSPLQDAQLLAYKAQQRFLETQADEKISADNALRVASAALVWDHLRDNVVVPQIEAVLEANGLLNGVKGIEMLDRIRNSPQDFIPKVGPLKDLPRLIETAKKVVGVEESMEAFALAAAEANAQMDTAQADALAGRLFAGLSQQGIDIMRTASDAMESQQGKIAQVLMERAPQPE